MRWPPGRAESGLRAIDPPFVAPGPCGVAVRWAARKRELTGESSARWAGAITKATHDQWALARRCQHAHVRSLEAGVKTIEHRLSLPIAQKGTEGAPGGYRSRQEWFAKSRRLGVLRVRLERERADFASGLVHVVRGGKKLARNRHHLDEAQLTEGEWREQWQARRWFLQADGESGKRYGNETIRATPDGRVSIRLPAPLAHLANAPHGRYVLAARVRFAHRGTEWLDRVEADRAVAYRIHLDAARGRWYLTASWQTPTRPAVTIRAALAEGVIGVDTNADHLAAWRLDRHGNPIGAPRRFGYDLTGSTGRRDAQVRRALTRLLHWAETCGVRAIAVEDLDFAQDKTRERHGRRKRFRQLISNLPTGRLRVRLNSMADRTGIAIIAVDPAYTSKWGARHWQEPLTSKTRKTTRHDAAGIAIGRRAQGHPIRRRTAPPPAHRSDEQGHRTVQARPAAPGREGTRRPATDHAHDACRRAGSVRRTRETSASRTVRDARGAGRWVQDPLMDAVQER
ncbi:IS200/IS605 family element transposase accessory protein TnpB [Actinomadura soli]|uniref:IS200/IS605 family element transposase accessory protein TnpB n=2 Tax=Actinomadura soli TaxID=2508997 RepID=A0A5C4J9R4_9ACTN|nr:IS200/IS605 family element transposase accessory protein TnpB [Actinomadura soli]